MTRTCDDCRDRDPRVRCFACYRAEQAAGRADQPEAGVVVESEDEVSSSPDDAWPAAAAPGGRLNDGQIAHRRAMLAHLTYKLNH